MQMDTTQQHTDLRNELTEIEVNHFEKLDKMISDVKRTFTSSKEGLLATENKISKISKDLETKISLNIGGRIFTTTLGNLVQEKGTFFSAMFSDHFDSTPDKDGTYFIDRDSDLFVPIIRYLRNPTALPDFIQLDKDGLFDLFEQEVDFYQIRSLKKIMTEYIRIKILSMEFSIERVIRREKSELMIAGPTLIMFADQEHKNDENPYGAEMILQPCARWKIIVLGKLTRFFVGVVPETYEVNPTELDCNPYEACTICSTGERWVWPDCLDDVYDTDPAPDWKCPIFNDGSVVELTLKDGSLCITVNGNVCDPAFENVPKEYIYPYISVVLDEFSNVLIEKLE
jgi:hypothetical protein